jgi:phosphoenolpyruvate carboxylase
MLETALNAQVMSITIEIPPELLNQLKLVAENKDKALEEVILEFLQSGLGLDEESWQEKGQWTESELLEKIQLGIPPDEWKRYHHLIEMRDTERITQAEHEELLHLIERIEKANARRVGYLIELAKVRKEPLEVTMEKLGILN